MPSIFYFCPDFPLPSAGTKRLYRHVRHLNQAGFKAFIVHQQRGFSLAWHGIRVPVLWLEDRPHFENDSVLVFPEVMSSLMQQTRELALPRIVIALNWALIYRNLPAGKNWKDFGISTVITPSPFVKRFIEWTMGLDVTLIENYVDTTKYAYQPEKKINNIAYISRKDLSGEILRSVFERKQGPLRHYNWIRLGNLNEEHYASQLAHSRIFLATSQEEGMPTSVLEAMASGCIVIGYSGLGGRDFMRGDGPEQNCVLVENGDYLALGKSLERVADTLRTEDHPYDPLINNALQTGSAFRSQEREVESLRRFFLSLL